ncbi:MAG: MAPEG family protein [Hahellaceae bacterium]|nr:MAPEG family protein [Hahellaceae bacterium]MCP5211505.1 MAPEG family protein [Hahellaceae bacterium]
MNLLNTHWEFGVFVLLNATLILLLAINVSRLRIQKKQSLGDGGDKALSKAIRAHANAIEFVPIYALTILALSFLNVSEAWLLTLVLGFTAGRILHAYGMLTRVFQARQGGALLSYLFQALAIILLLVKLAS